MPRKKTDAARKSKAPPPRKKTARKSKKAAPPETDADDTRLAELVRAELETAAVPEPEVMEDDSDDGAYPHDASPVEFDPTPRRRRPAAGRKTSGPRAGRKRPRFERQNPVS